MTEARCPACEALMSELYCYDCLRLEREAATTPPSETLRKSHCSAGHAFTPDNTRINKSPSRAGGYQVCRKCHADRCAQRRARIAAVQAAS